MAKETQQTLIDSSADSGPVECLGMTFENDAARREHFLGLLAEQLKDPNFRKIEGFPAGTDEDILAISDPPFYTACPNPFIESFLLSNQKNRDCEDYRRKPFAVDVSVGKTDQLYRAHGYHTKVPHLAIVPSILNYTQPGDVVLDGFCGSGMTGVAVNWCSSAPIEYRKKIDSTFEEQGRDKPEWGARIAILGDLSPAATFIAYSFNTEFEVEQFKDNATALLVELYEELGWAYETNHRDGVIGKINYTVWSEVFNCGNCAAEIVFVKEALNPVTKRVESTINCPSCGAESSKEKLELQFESVTSVNGDIRRRPRRVPAIINYSVGKAVYEKEPDTNDLDVIRRVEQLQPAGIFPQNEFPECQMLRVGRMASTNVKFVDDLFIHRAAVSMSRMWEKACEFGDVKLRNNLLYFVEQAIWGMSVLNRYKTIMHGKTSSSNVNQYLSGVFYVPSQTSEVSPWYNLTNRLKRLTKNAFARRYAKDGTTYITTGSCAKFPIPDNSIDYIFTDPPFGENIYYSDLNYLVESWHRVFTDATPEAIVDRVRGKGILDYQRLMHASFVNYFRVLKPGRWLTVVFHNSKNSVWNAIQESLEHAGFVVADVRTLDKKQGSFQQVVSGNTVKRDLVISAYKPNGGLEQRFELVAGTEDGVWDFISTHLNQLPVFVEKKSVMETIGERTDHMLFDRMVAFHVQRGVSIPLSAAEFRGGLSQKYPERDGMFFLAEQVPEYDKKRIRISEVSQLQLFVKDEATAVEWIRQSIKTKPQSFQELQPRFMKEVAAWDKYEKPIELSQLLEDNFLIFEGEGNVPNQIHSYLSSNFHDLRKLGKNDPKLIEKSRNRWYVPDSTKESDLEKLRNRRLLKEFRDYVASKGSLKVVRSESLRAGFKECWANNDYATIIGLANRVKDEIIQEDPALLMYYDNALMRTED